MKVTISPIFAADFSVGGLEKPGCEKIRGEDICISLSLVGRIQDGDTEKLQFEVARAETEFSTNGSKARVGHIFLESPGGSMKEAIRLGRYLRSIQISTQVAKGDACASACVLVLASGVTRVPAGDVVIHSFYSPDVLGTNDFSRAEIIFASMSESVSKYLKDMRVSSLLLEEMIRVPHFKSRKLDVDELVKLGLLGIDPVYAQVRAEPGLWRSEKN